MKKAAVVTTGALFILTMCVVTGQAQSADKFGYVDLSRSFSEYNKTKDYDKALTDKENTYTTEREKKVNEFKQLKDKFDLLSDKEKETKKGDLENKAKVVQDFDREKQTDLRKEQDEKMKEILKNIEDTVKQYAEKEGYTFVFNDRVLVYQDKKYDMTDKIIEILNKGYKK